MNLFQKLTVGAVMSLTLMAPSSLVSQASAGPGHAAGHHPVHRPRPTPKHHHHQTQGSHAHSGGHHRSYWIAVRSSPDHPWARFGPYANQEQARYAVNQARSQGYDVFVQGR